MYRENDLIIRPAYQRLFRWDAGRQSRFIESLTLEMPVPPIFVIEDESGRYELIDGLQRISSYLHFRGALEAKEQSISPGDFLKLTECDILTELNGLTYKELPTVLELKLKRHFTRVEVIRKESDPSLRYHMFKRLNTGGALLSEQELRNCTIRMLDSTFIDAIGVLATFEYFRRCLEYVTNVRMSTLFDQELVLRFFAFKNWRSHYEHEIGAFLTDYMEEVTRGQLAFDYASEASAFKKTFHILALTLGANAFARTNEKNSFVQTFSAVHFDAVTLGIQPFLDRIDPAKDADISRVREALTAVKISAEFREMTTGGGLNFSKLANARVDFITAAFTSAFDK